MCYLWRQSNAWLLVWIAAIVVAILNWNVAWRSAVLLLIAALIYLVRGLIAPFLELKLALQRDSHKRPFALSRVNF